MDGLGKKLSLFSKIIAIIFLIGFYVGTLIFKGNLPTGDQAFGLIQIAIFIASVFVPVDLSIIVKNIKGLNGENK